MALGLAGVVAVIAHRAGAQQSPLPHIAIAMSVTGEAEPYGRPAMEGATLALEELNADGAGAIIEATTYDDRSDPALARRLAGDIAAGDVLAVVGPATTAPSLAAGPVYAAAGLVSIGTTATSDQVTDNPTVFRASFTTGDGGDAIANYLRHVLGGTRAAVVFRKDGYGTPAADGFRRAAGRLGIDATYHPFASAADLDAIVAAIAADPEQPAIVAASLDRDAAEIVKRARRRGAKGPIFGTGAIAGEFFSALFAAEPEARDNPGFFTDGIYAASPEIFDSANAATSAFADRYRARFGKDANFYSVQGYEAMRLAVAAVRASAAAPDVKAQREAVRRYLLSLDGPARAVPGLNGPLWFTPERGRIQPLRMGRFHGAAFESAPIQLVPVRHPGSAEIAAGKVVDIGSGRFARLQRVVYTGVYLNEISQLDVANATFTADVYVWMRSAGAGDPVALTEVQFPGMIRGTFDSTRPALQGELDDGTTYRLWQIRGDFRNDYDLRLYPFDRQILSLGFFHPRADADRVVYAQDKRSVRGALSALRAATSQPASSPSLPTFADASALAFRHLTQWEPIRTSQGRDSLLTESALGDPRLVGFERMRELSGFRFSVELRRRVLANLTKTLLPLLLMALILYASMHFPASLTGTRSGIAVTCALAGTVLLSSINAQLGSVGYVMAVEYGFYGFFALCLVCIVALLLIERYRLADRHDSVIAVERISKRLFLAGLGAILLAAAVTYVRS